MNELRAFIKGIADKLEHDMDSLDTVAKMDELVRDAVYEINYFLAHHPQPVGNPPPRQPETVSEDATTNEVNAARLSEGTRVILLVGRWAGQVGVIKDNQPLMNSDQYAIGLVNHHELGSQWILVEPTEIENAN